MPPLMVQVETGQRPLEISCFPGDDVEFGMTVVTTASDLRPQVGDNDTDLAARLTARVRQAYPAARIQLRHELASWRGSRPRLFYAFRDGAAHPTTSPGQDDARVRGA
jgi:hypothetical protein